MISELPWFRLVANKDGTIASVEEFSGARDEKGRSVHFLQAKSREDAIKVWAEKYDLGVAAAILRNKARYSALIPRGLCGACGKGALASKTLCRVCADAKALRQRAVRSGLVAKRPRKTLEMKAASAMRESRRTSQSGSDAIKRLCYSRALEAFDSMPPSRFRGWLVAKISEQQDKIDAKRKAWDAKNAEAKAKADDSNTARVIAAALQATKQKKGGRSRPMATE